MINQYLNRKEVIGVAVILFLILTLSLINYQTSLRRARDVQRTSDISGIAQGLEKYAKDYGFYPQASNGKILACEGPETDIKDKLAPLIYKKPKLIGLVECQWGEDSLMDVLDHNYPHYLEVISSDPESDRGDEYVYFSNGERFQIFGSFEGRDQVEYSSAVKSLKIQCGRRRCNFGKASSNMVLDKMIEEYENELGE